MLTIGAILDHLRDKEFTEQELRGLLVQLVRDHREDAANKAVAKYASGVALFKKRREKRLRKEFRDTVLPEINAIRAVIRKDQAQEMYKKTRRDKNAARRGTV